MKKTGLSIVVGWMIFCGMILIPQTASAEGVFSLSDGGAIESWLYAGPISDPPDSEPLVGHDTAFLKEGDRVNIAPKRGDIVSIRNATSAWTPIYSESEDIRFSDRFPNLQRITAYFFCELESDRDRSLIMRIARDDTVKVWLSGRLVYNNAQPNDDFERIDEIKITLHEGRQSLLVKLCQNSGFCGFRVELKDARGDSPSGIRVILPGTFPMDEYMDACVSLSIPPLIDRDGKRIVRLRFPSYIQPDTIKSLVLYEAENRRKSIWMKTGMIRRSIDFPIDRESESRDYVFQMSLQEQILEKRITVKPCRDWRVYLLPGSHVDIGYTDLQSRVMADHKNYYRQAWDLYEASKKNNLMRDAQYIWNPEVTWVVKDFFQTESDRDCLRLVDYLRRGVFSLDALYCNLLTALCGDEELIRSVYYSTHLAERENLPPVLSAMITDVPGYTWGIVPVLSGAGIKYFDLGPNFDARIGLATKALGNHPYYWFGPDGISHILVWNTGLGYSNTFDMLRSENGVDRFLLYLSNLEEDENYPYDIARIRAYLVDNTPPPDHLSEMVQAWNEKYDVPHLILSGAPAPFQDLESKYAGKIPSYKGDYTPYWEDGAASSARETALNRMATLSLQEAERMWALARAIGNKKTIPMKELERGYDFAMLYSEHTWGAHNSITEPDSFFVQDQWRVKRGFAENAFWLSSQLKQDGIRALSERIQNATPFTFAIWNLTQWPRSEEVVLDHSDSSKLLQIAEQWVAVDNDGHSSPVLHDRRGSVFMAYDVPSLGYKTYRLQPQSSIRAESTIHANASNGILLSQDWEIKVDSQTGGIASLLYLPQNRQWVDTNSPYHLNQYLYAQGPNGKESQCADQVILQVDENGDSRSLIARVAAPGVEWLRQEIRLYPEENRIDLINTLEKKDIREKEAVRFAFPFQVPKGQFTLEIPLASMHPETEQLPGANRNIYTIRRWVDISNQDYGVTWVSNDAPLVELGEMYAEQEWLERLPLQNTHLFSYGMNNYWFTNYKASQGGPATFRYSLWFHEGSGKPDASTRFADRVTSPFIAVPLRNNEDTHDSLLPPSEMSLMSIDAPHVLIQNIKWAENGNGILLRVRELDGFDTNAQIAFPVWKSFQWQRCDLVERPIPGEYGKTTEGILPISIRGKEIRTYLIHPSNEYRVSFK